MTVALAGRAEQGHPQSFDHSEREEERNDLH
jgi:hypothetical protein